MAVYFASDMHLRIDRPDRGERLARWVKGLSPGDSLYLVGDVCDFWFASRQRKVDPMACVGLKALADFRSAGGRLTILPGNHDLWLGRFYERVLGASFLQEPQIIEAYGQRVLIVHGHRTGGRPPWKAVMESRAFLHTFEYLPAPIADGLDRKLESTNDETRLRDERRLIPHYRRYLEMAGTDVDLVVFGHIHTPLDDPSSRPRLVILGGWHNRTSYLRLDDRGATLVVEHDPSRVAI